MTIIQKYFFKEIFSCCIPGGVIRDWRGMEDIWRYSIQTQLNVNTRDHPTLLSVHPLTSLKDKTRMMEVMLESLCVPSVSLQVGGVLALHGSGERSVTYKKA